MKTTSLLLRAANALFVTLAIALTGCVQTGMPDSRPRRTYIGVNELPAGEVAPKPTFTVAPTIPYAMMSDGVGGLVRLNCLIDAQGKIKDIEVVDETNYHLGSAALAAVWQWKFAPGTRDGQATEMRVQVPIHFGIVDSSGVSDSIATPAVAKR